MMQICVKLQLQTAFLPGGCLLRAKQKKTKPDKIQTKPNQTTRTTKQKQTKPPSSKNKQTKKPKAKQQQIKQHT